MHGFRGQIGAITLVLGLGPSVAPAEHAHAVPSPEQAAFFESKVRPLLVEHCHRCHSADAEARDKLKAGLRVDSLAGLLAGGDSGPALVPGNPEASLIIEAVGYRNEDMAMPPKAKLPDAPIAALTEWVRMGAPWPGSPDADTAAAGTSTDGTDQPFDWERFRREHWAFQPVAKPEPPEAAATGWGRSPIDRFVLAKLEEAGLEPNGPADRRALVRRAWLDLVGLPPPPEAVEAFVADESPDAFATVVDGLLASEHYGERWARHWMDVARYSDGFGGFGDTNPLPDAWRYRDWLVAAFNDDLPYDAFVTRQIAGDLLEETPDPVATGFFVVGPTYQSDGGDPEAKAQAEAETLSDRVDTLSRGFLGLTAACARCHHHKSDPVSTEDYYALAGIFRNTRTTEHPVDPPAAVEAYHAAQKAIGDEEAAVNRFLDEASKRLGVERKEVEKALDEAERQQLAALRTELERLKESAPPKYATAHVLADSGSADMHVALRGDLRKEGALVPRRFLTILAGDEAAPFNGKGSGRLELARAVTAPDNPLTARVIVNRVWGWHFGRGLVRSPSNFGVLGEPPTHPGLLDWLAADFVEHGWSLKRLHRQILLSSTWRMSSAFDSVKFERDGDNRLLWRMNPRRLEVEAWRDSLLAVTGELDGTVGGPPAGEILASTRRTLYATISRTGDRSESDAFLRLFDFPAAASSSAQRSTSTVPQHYLFMMNSRFMQARAEALGGTLHAMESSLAHRIDAAYRRLYSRPPEAAEVALAEEWLGDAPDRGAWDQFAQVLLSTHELIQLR